MSATRRIILTEENGRWVAEDTETGIAGRGETRVVALENLDEAIAEGVNGGRSSTDEEPPAAPLYGLIGLVDEAEAGRVRERSRAFREEFDERIDRTRRELSDGK
ncbi:type II toxin-antitoxin system HicB family antitoxin [Halomarina pelagica]|uniref:type II toxin-antitoxin system HicB family antitoxin n=1 Tax=Halomarina pelagica TaxID=2961599 RepID=UPI0020C47F2A|nr:hypothetical protein [Halomarina sp. BND7]